MGFPEPNQEQGILNYYVGSLKEALESSKKNLEIRNYERANLEYLCKVLDITSQGIGNDKDESWFCLLTRKEHKSVEGHPEGSDIYFKFYDFCLKSILDKDILEEKEQCRQMYNLNKDCQRVVKKILNNESLHLIRDEVKTFENFLEELAHQPIKNLFG